jgi:excisionase family DNA binding protein
VHSAAPQRGDPAPFRGGHLESRPARRMSERLVTASELAEVLGVSPATILNHFEAGKLSGYKIGRAVRFDVEEVLSACRRTARADSPTLELVRREE